MVQEKYEASQAQMERDSMVLIEGKWIVQNLQCLRRQIQVPIMAVVKNNGYGLGLKSTRCICRRWAFGILKSGCRRGP